MVSKKLTLTALLVALVTLTTMVVNIPLPGVKGYVNIGDTVVLLSGLLFGPGVGVIAGGLGSALADLYLGYAYWAPLTLLIKGLEGFLAGWLIFRFKNASFVVAMLAALVMVAGYFLAGSILYGIGPAVASLPGDLLQAGASVVLSMILLNPLRKYLSL